MQTDGISINIKRKNNEEKIFRFNHVMNPGDQKELYERCNHLVEGVFDGHNATFLAYGQTGTGKTYTVFGNEKQEQGYFNLSV
jgi:kinesin family member 18/19